MTGRWKAWKTSRESEQGRKGNERFPPLPTAPWKSPTRFLQFHSPDDDDSLLPPRGHFYCLLTEENEYLAPEPRIGVP